ncbi:MAG: hypothetical protein ACM3MF_11440 [Anaerolineae bacterium]
MNPRTTAIVSTAAATLLCGCPGLFLCLWGLIGAAGVPINTELNGTSSTAPMSTATAVGLLCAALVLILIPIAVAFFTFRRKPAAVVVTPSEPIPPAS